MQQLFSEQGMHALMYPIYFNFQAILFFFPFQFIIYLIFFSRENACSSSHRLKMCPDAALHQPCPSAAGLWLASSLTPQVTCCSDSCSPLSFK